jgi:hypothetical protein
MKRPKRTGEDKFRTYRARKQHQGMKLLRVWVPDPTRPEFASEAARQAALLRGRPEEAEALDIISHAAAWLEP